MATAANRPIRRVGVPNVCFTRSPLLIVTGGDGSSAGSVCVSVTPITADTVTLANFLRESKTPSLLASTGRYPRLAATLDSVVMLRPEYIECPLPGRLTERFPMRDEVLTRHREAVANHQPTYRDPLSGYSVFTAAFLAGRGYCCASGCRHCPYEPMV